MPTGRNTTNSVLAKAISAGERVTFQIRGILGFNFEYSTHGSVNKNLVLLIAFASAWIGRPRSSNAGKL